MSETAPRWRRVVRSPIGWAIPISLTIQGRILGLRFEDTMAEDVWTLFCTLTTWVLLWIVLIRSARWSWWVRLLAFLPQIVLQPACVMMFSTPINRMINGRPSERSEAEVRLDLSERDFLRAVERRQDGDPIVAIYQFELLPLGLARKVHVKSYRFDQEPKRLVLESLAPDRAELQVFAGPWSFLGPTQKLRFDHDPVD